MSTTTVSAYLFNKNSNFSKKYTGYSRVLNNIRHIASGKADHSVGFFFTTISSFSIRFIKLYKGVVKGLDRFYLHNDTKTVGNYN